MASLNRKNDEMYHLMNARTDKRNEVRPKALTGTKLLGFEVLEYYRVFLNEKYKSKLYKILKLLKS